MRIWNAAALTLALTVLGSCALPAAAPNDSWQQDRAPWRGQPTGKVLDLVHTEGVLEAGPARVGADETGATCLDVPFRFGTDGPRHVFQAEDARLHGVVPYTHDRAYGGRMVGAFGDFAGDFIEFSAVADVRQLNFGYCAATAAPQQCSLYLDDRDVATLVFEPTGGWYGPYRVVSWHSPEPVSGVVRLQVDEDDIAANQGFICNVDYLSLGPVAAPVPSRFTVSVPLAAPELDQPAYAVSVAARGTVGLVTLIVVDADGVAHRSLDFTVDKQAWDRLTVLLGDVEPALAPNIAVQRLDIHVNGDSRVDEGTFAVKDVLWAAGWPSTPPADCPLPRSHAFATVRFTGRHASYGGGDT